MSSKGGQIRTIVRQYQAAGRPWPATTDQIAEWAIREGRWKDHPRAARRRCAREIGRAMREEYITDAFGRRVRAKHPVTRKAGDDQTTLWDDIRSASRNHMAMSFLQRRERIVNDCKQLKTDADSYNDAHHDQKAIQLSFDFRQDLAELEALERLTRRLSDSPPSSIGQPQQGGQSPRVRPESAFPPSPYPH